MKRSPLLSIFLIVLVDIMGYTIILPLLPFYTEAMGGTPFIVGLLLSSYGFCQMMAGPVLGRISDQIGRKPVLLFSQIGTLAGYILLASAPDLRIVFLARMIDGITAGNISVAQAFIADVTEPQHRAKAFALIGIAFGVGFLIGPAVSGVLAHFGPQYPIYFAVFLSAVTVLTTFFLLPHTRPHPPTPSSAFTGFKLYQKFFSEPELGVFLREFFSFIFAFSLFISGFALFAERRFTWNGHPFGVKEVSYVFAYVGLLGVIIQGFGISRIVRAFGELKPVRAGFILMAAGFVMAAWVRSIPLLLIAVTLSFLGSSILRPCLTSLITQKAGKGQQGEVLGLTQSLMSLSQIVTPLVSGALIQHELLMVWALAGGAVSFSGLFFKKRS